MPLLARSATRTVDASSEPLNCGEVRDALGITGTTLHDAQLDRMIKSARIKVEKDSRRAFIGQTWQTKLHRFPAFRDFIELPRPPLLKITTGSITYLGTTGDTKTLSSSVYAVDTVATPGRIYLDYNQSWPTNIRNVDNAITINSIHGYTTATSQPLVPEDAKQAMLMLIDDWFCHRGIDGPSNRDNYNSLIQTLRWGDYR